MAERVETAAVKGASCAWKACVTMYEVIVAGCTMFGSCVKQCPASYISAVLRVLNLGNAVLLGAACYFAFQTIVGPGDVTRTFLAIYCGIFGALLALFETRVAYTAPFIAKNCGFLFTASGRTAFLIFLGAMCFGLLDGSNNKSSIGYNMCLGAGISTFANAFFNCFIICNHPEFQEINRQNSAPAGSDPSKMSEADVRKYLEAHPEIAAAALGASKAPGAAAAAAAPAQPASEPDWVKAAEARAASEGNSGAKSAKGGGGWGFGFGGSSQKASAAAPPPDTYVPPVVPFTASAPAPKAAAPPPPALPGGAFNADVDNPFSN